MTKLDFKQADMDIIKKSIETINDHIDYWLKRRLKEEKKLKELEKRCQ